MNIQDQEARRQALHKRVENDLTYHEGPPDVGPGFYDQLRHSAKILAHFIVSTTPMNREQSLALTHIEEAVQWAIASIVRYPGEKEQPVNPLQQWKEAQSGRPNSSDNNNS